MYYRALETVSVCAAVGLTVAITAVWLSFENLKQTGLGAKLFHQRVLEQWKPSACRSILLHKTTPVSTGSKASSAKTLRFATPLF